MDGVELEKTGWGVFLDIPMGMFVNLKMIIVVLPKVVGDCWNDSNGQGGGSGEAITCHNNARNIVIMDNSVYDCTNGFIVAAGAEQTGWVGYIEIYNNKICILVAIYVQNYLKLLIIVSAELLGLTPDIAVLLIVISLLILLMVYIYRMQTLAPQLLIIFFKM